MKLVHDNNLETAKMLINHDKDLKVELIKRLTKEENFRLSAKKGTAANYTVKIHGKIHCKNTLSATPRWSFAVFAKA